LGPFKGQKGIILVFQPALHFGAVDVTVIGLESEVQRLPARLAVELKQNEILRVATGNDATTLLYEMDAVLLERDDAADASDSGAIADDMVSHMSAYMETCPQ